MTLSKLRFWLTVVCSISVWTFLSSCDSTNQIPDYFGQTPPSLTPEIFAPGIISVEGRLEEAIAFSPNGKEIWFSYTNQDWSWFTLQYVEETNGVWSETKTPPFTGQYIDMTPRYSLDGERLFFSSIRPTAPPWIPDFYEVHREGGGWSEPLKLGDKPAVFGVTSNGGTVWYLPKTLDGGLGAEDIYRFTQNESDSTVFQNLGSSVNSEYNEWSVAVSPEDGFIVFGSDRPTGAGWGDLYVSFQRSDSTWTEAQSLGIDVNTEYHENSPFISLDGRYLFFHRRNNVSATDYTAAESDIYWVSMELVTSMRPL